MTTKFKNETKAKRITFLFIITFFTIAILCSCDKDKSEPIVEEEQPVVVVPTPVQPTCKTNLKRFTGKYMFIQNSSATLSIEFVKNNCPTNYSNTYLVKGLSNSFSPLYVDENTTPVTDANLTFVSQEAYRLLVNETEKVTFKWDSLNPQNLHVVCTKLHNFSTTDYIFYKLE